MTSLWDIKNNSNMSKSRLCPECRKAIFVKCKHGEGCPCQGSKEKVVKMHAARDQVKDMTTSELIEYHVNKILYSKENRKQNRQARAYHRRAIKKLLSRSVLGRSIIKMYKEAKKDQRVKIKPPIDIVYFVAKGSVQETDGSFDEMNRQLDKTD